MSIDYFVELDKQSNPKNTDQFTTHYHRLITDGKKKDADALRDQWRKAARNLSLTEPSGEMWNMIARPTVDRPFSLPAHGFCNSPSP